MTLTPPGPSVCSTKQKILQAYFKKGHKCIKITIDYSRVLYPWNKVSKVLVHNICQRLAGADMLTVWKCKAHYTYFSIISRVKEIKNNPDPNVFRFEYIFVIDQKDVIDRQTQTGNECFTPLSKPLSSGMTPKTLRISYEKFYSMQRPALSCKRIDVICPSKNITETEIPDKPNSNPHLSKPPLSKTSLSSGMTPQTLSIPNENIYSMQRPAPSYKKIDVICPSKNITETEVPDKPDSNTHLSKPPLSKPPSSKPPLPKPSLSLGMTPQTLSIPNEDIYSMQRPAPSYKKIDVIRSSKNITETEVPDKPDSNEVEMIDDAQNKQPNFQISWTMPYKDKKRKGSFDLLLRWLKNARSDNANVISAKGIIRAHIGRSQIKVANALIGFQVPPLTDTYVSVASQSDNLLSTNTDEVTSEVYSRKQTLSDCTAKTAAATPICGGEITSNPSINVVSIGVSTDKLTLVSSKTGPENSTINSISVGTSTERSTLDFFSVGTITETNISVSVGTVTESSVANLTSVGTLTEPKVKYSVSVGVEAGLSTFHTNSVGTITENTAVNSVSIKTETEPLLDLVGNGTAITPTNVTPQTASSSRSVNTTHPLKEVPTTVEHEAAINKDIVIMLNNPVAQQLPSKRKRPQNIRRSKRLTSKKRCKRLDKAL